MTSSPKCDPRKPRREIATLPSTITGIKVSQERRQFNVEWPVWDEYVGFRDELVRQTRAKPPRPAL
jgi:hypothetical protein